MNTLSGLTATSIGASSRAMAMPQRVPGSTTGDGIAVVVGDVQEALGVYREVLRCLIHCNEVDGFVAGGVDDRYGAPAMVRATASGRDIQPATVPA